MLQLRQKRLVSGQVFAIKCPVLAVNGNRRYLRNTQGGVILIIVTISLRGYEDGAS